MKQGVFARLLLSNVPGLVWVALGASVSFAACRPTDPALVPDSTLQAELGLTEKDRVHTVAVQTAVGERADPEHLVVEEGDLVSFESADGFVHEVRFELDSLDLEQRTFLTDRRQDVSPPLVSRGARFVMTLEGAPYGRYPYLLQGNRAPGRGVLVVRDPNAG
ncbi:MAG: hypothetical protein AAF389_00325 [Gemmatimonadota bacterium]